MRYLGAIPARRAAGGKTVRIAQTCPGEERHQARNSKDETAERHWQGLSVLVSREAVYLLSAIFTSQYFLMDMDSWTA